MTKERRWAIQMWEQIKELLPEWYISNKFTVSEKMLMFKYQFCCDKKVHWKNNCWLCQYARIPYCNCERCPLETCGYMNNGKASPWQVVMDYHYSLELKLRACDTIITALKGAVNV